MGSFVTSTHDPFNTALCCSPKFVDGTIQETLKFGPTGARCNTGLVMVFAVQMDPLLAKATSLPPPAAEANLIQPASPGTLLERQVTPELVEVNIQSWE